MSEGMIIKNGDLKILRAGAMETGTCPKVEEGLACGDWCILFGEPEAIENRNASKIKLSLCQKTYVFDKFKDLRNKA